VRQPTLRTLVAALALTAAAPAPAALAARADDADLVVLDAGLTELHLVGLLQLELAPYVGDDAFVSAGDPAEAPGFRLRRARLGIAGTAWGDTDYELSLQATPDGVDLLDAWVGWRPVSNFALYGGARKVPFSRFALVGSADGALADRPLAVRAMAPFRQVGLTLEGDLGNGLFSWAAGAYNGFVRGVTFHEGYGESTALAGNRFTNLAYAARVATAPFGPLGDGLADLDGGPLRAGLGAATYYDDGDTVKTLGFEADLLVKVAGFHFAAEILVDSAEPAKTPATDATPPTTIDRRSVVAELGYMVLPGLLGLTLRGELLDDDTALDDAGDSLVVTGGVQLYARARHLKASLEFTHREERHGVALDNDALLLQLQFGL